MHNLMENAVLTMVSDQQISAVTAINSSSVDMDGFDGVVFFGQIVTAHVNNFANAATSSDDSTFNDLAGTKVLSTTSDDTFCIDVYRPLERYLRCEIDRGGATTATGPIYALQYNARKAPTSQGSTVNLETHISPAEGTA